MTKAEKLYKAKEIVAEMLSEVLAENEAIQTGNFANVIQTEVDGQEIYVEIALTAKNFQSTKKTEAFNPIQANEDYEFDKRQREQKAKAKAEEKAKKEAEKAKRK